MKTCDIKTETELIIGKICDDVELEVDADLSNVGCYLPEEDQMARILIAKSEIINKIIKNMFHNKVNFREMIYTVTLHEIGHHLDVNRKEKSEQINELVEEMHGFNFQEVSYLSFSEREQQNIDYFTLRFKIEELTIKMEKVAWNIACDLNRSFKLVEDSVFKKIKQVSLETYENKFQRAKKELESIIEIKNTQ